MKISNKWDKFIQECELEFNKLEEDKSYCFTIYEKIIQHFNLCLKTKQYKSLLDLIDYFTKPDSYPNFHLTAEMRRTFVLLNILTIELKHEKIPFVSTANDFNSFQEQYILTVFAMRRLELMLSDDSMNEAQSYLLSIPFSMYAARFILENEIFENYQKLYWNLYICMKSAWSATDKIQWLVCILEKSPSDEILLEIASLYLEFPHYPKAYEYLTQIQKPSSQIIELISSIKELI